MACPFPKPDQPGRWWPLGAIASLGLGVLVGCGRVETVARVELEPQTLGIQSADALARLVDRYQPGAAAVQRAAERVGAKPTDIRRAVDVECTTKTMKFEWARAFCDAIAPDFAAYSQIAGRQAGSN